MRNKVIDLLDQTIEELDKETIDGILEIPPKDDMGDFAFPCFQLAKVFRKAPNMIATEIAEKIPASEDVSKVEAMGPYVNFFLNKENYVKEVLAKVNGTYGAQEIGKGKTVCIDYSSPNIAKNFHVGHLRTTIIGNSLYHIFDKLGYKVERINHLGDWGTQFGKLIVAYKKWGSKEAVEEKGIPELLRIYVKFHEEAEKDDTLNDQAREWFAKMEQGDEEALSIWEWFKDISMVEYKRIYKMLNMDFDHYTGESFYRDKTAAVVEELKENNIKFLNPFLPFDPKTLAETILDLPEFKEYNFTKKELIQAAKKAEKEYQNFKNDIRTKGREALEYMQKHNLKGIVLAGRPYHTDPEVNHGIDTLITGLGLCVLTEDSIADMATLKYRLRVVNQWVYHARLYAAADFVGKQKDLELVQLNNFGCGDDPVTTDQVEEILESYGKMYTLIKIDEVNNLGAVRIRIRSLLASMKKREKEANSQNLKEA